MTVFYIAVNKYSIKCMKNNLNYIIYYTFSSPNFLRYSKRSFKTEELKELISSMNLLSFPYKVSFESTLRRKERK